MRNKFTIDEELPLDDGSRGIALVMHHQQSTPIRPQPSFPRRSSCRPDDHYYQTYSYPCRGTARRAVFAVHEDHDDDGHGDDVTGVVALLDAAGVVVGGVLDVVLSHHVELLELPDSGRHYFPMICVSTRMLMYCLRPLAVVAQTQPNANYYYHPTICSMPKGSS